MKCNECDSEMTALPYNDDSPEGLIRWCSRCGTMMYGMANYDQVWSVPSVVTKAAPRVDRINGMRGKNDTQV